jgi:transmembrane sensor
MAAPSFSEDVADAAARWLTLFMSGEADDADRARWHAWRNADAEHERAWQHIEAVTTRLKELNGRAAGRSLSSAADMGPPGGRARRRAVRSLAVLAAAGLGAALVSRTERWQQWTAEHRTGTGEQRQLQLADGSRLMLNTRSAVELRFDDRERLLRLVAGEVWIVTGHPTRPAPFVVETRDGRIRALGTRFSVRQSDGGSRVAVAEGAVEVLLPGQPSGARVLQAGRHLSFSAHAIASPEVLGEQDLAWTRGLIVADGMPLADFLDELGRYRSGVLHCDPAVSGLRLSGVFPVGDTDRILQALPRVLPVQLNERTRYWVSVGPRG